MQWLAGLALLILASQTASGTGRVTGVVTDTSGVAEGAIPGATITLRSGSWERTTVTDSRGAFSFENVPRGRYAVIASLWGFYGEPGTRVSVAAGETATLKLILATECLLHAERVEIALARAIVEAALVAHIRISTPASAACAVADHCACTLHNATVSRVLKGDAKRELRLLQEGAGYGGAERPYAAGQEFIALLKMDDENHAFRRIAGPTHMLRVLDGRVSIPEPAPAGFRDGMTLAEFERAVRAVR